MFSDTNDRHLACKLGATITPRVPGKEGGAEMVSPGEWPLEASRPHPRQEAGFQARRCREGLGQERRDQEAASPKSGRGAATEAGVAVKANFHPLVKVFIFPTSFSVLPRLRPPGWSACAVTPAVALRSEIKIHPEGGADYRIHKVPTAIFSTVFIGPSGPRPEFFCPTPACRLSRSPAQSGGPRGHRGQATARSGSGRSVHARR
ncbi:MAG: hypothetical protein JWN05_3405 [Arthrobacter sp.]|jgi:hypothetical protein|nr:hypothetical protein [Arthrobacter sp.]